MEHNVLTLNTMRKRNVKRYEPEKSFPSHKAHRAALIVVLLALSQTPAFTARPRGHGNIVHRAVCLFTPQLSVLLAVALPTDGWPG